MREACRAIRYTVQPFATFSSCSLMTTWTSADRQDWLATKITVAKETWNEQSMKCTFNQKKCLKKNKGEVWAHTVTHQKLLLLVSGGMTGHSVQVHQISQHAMA